MNPDLLRQRRNLMLVSLVLILFDVAGARLERIALLGNELIVARPGVLVVGAWVVFLYFLLRYSQYLKAAGDLGIAAAMKERIDRYARGRFTSLPAVDGAGGPLSYRLVRDKGCLRWFVTSDVYNVSTGTVEAVSKPAVGPITYGGWLMRAFLSVALRTPRVTDYLLPFALAAAVPIVSLVYLLRD